MEADRTEPGRDLRRVAGAAGYPPIETYAFLADGRSAALAGPDGAVESLCVPRFDGASVFARLLDRERGGAFELTVEGVAPPQRRYLDGTLVLESRFESDTASVAVFDFLALEAEGRHGRGQVDPFCALVRLVRCERGEARIGARIEARADYGRGRVVGISVDDAGRNAAMVEKLGLPFPLLSDPGGEGAIKPYGVWDPVNPLARTAVVVLAPDGRVTFREVGEDFADRMGDDEIVAALERLGLPVASQESPEPGQPAPGPRAVDLAWLPAYMRGGRGAVRALAGRVPAAQSEAEAMTKVYDRFIAALAQAGSVRRR